MARYEERLQFLESDLEPLYQQLSLVQDAWNVDGGSHFQDKAVNMYAFIRGTVSEIKEALSLNEDIDLSLLLNNAELERETFKEYLRLCEEHEEYRIGETTTESGYFPNIIHMDRECFDYHAFYVLESAKRLEGFEF